MQRFFGRPARSFSGFLVLLFALGSLNVSAQLAGKDTASHLYIDVHQLKPGSVTAAGVAGAHAKDLAVEDKYGVKFLKYWVDEKKGLVYCLSSTADSSAIRKTHGEAHGLLPDNIYPVTDGEAAKMKGTAHLFLDVHYLGAGKVTAADVAGAHKKDLAAEKKYGVNFINYWVDEKSGMVMCLSQAKDSAAVVNTHREAHGLIPQEVMEVKQGE